jgi:hypothetical protein
MIQKFVYQINWYSYEFDTHVKDLFKSNSWVIINRLLYTFWLIIGFGRWRRPVICYWRRFNDSEICISNQLIFLWIWQLTSQTIKITVFCVCVFFNKNLIFNKKKRRTQSKMNKFFVILIVNFSFFSFFKPQSPLHQQVSYFPR